MMCVATTRRPLARGRKIGHVITAGEALQDEQSLTAISLSSGCSIAVESLIHSQNFSGRFSLYIADGKAIDS